MKMKAVIFGDSHTRRLKAWKVFPKGGRKARTATADYDWSLFVKTCREAEKVVVLIGSNDIQQRLEELHSPQYAACAILAPFAGVDSASACANCRPVAAQVRVRGF